MKLICRVQFFTVLLGFALVLAGCKSPTPTTGEGANIDESQEADTNALTGVSPTDVGNMGVPEGQRMVIKDNVEYGKWSPIYFDYDSAVIRQADRAVLEEIAKWAKDNAEKKIMIAGHCDERGTLEYNRALGQRRALAAREYLVKLGASPKQIGTVSYGEEQPADPGHNEEAWAKNRRDEFGIIK